MRAVGIRELKNKLSHYVRLVKAGESVLVTHRGTVVECERVLIRAWSLDLITEAERADQSAHLSRAAAMWTRILP